MTVHQLERSMTSQELTEWMAFFSLEQKERDARHLGSDKAQGTSARDAAPVKAAPAPGLDDRLKQAFRRFDKRK